MATLATDEITAFMVLKEGVEIRGVYGPFFSKEAAQNFAYGSANRDRDGYHSWNVYKVNMESRAMGRMISTFRHRTMVNNG